MALSERLIIRVIREGTHRSMCGLMIHMNECAINTRQHLDLILQHLRDIVRFPQRSLARHHDVNLDEVIRAALQSSAKLR